MWTNENRTRYDRNRLHYPSDLTDAEWAQVEPLIPPAKRGGNRRHVHEREVVNGLLAANGVPSRRTCRRVRRFTITSIAGIGTARSIASTTRST